MIIAKLAIINERWKIEKSKISISQERLINYQIDYSILRRSRSRVADGLTEYNRRKAHLAAN